MEETLPLSPSHKAARLAWASEKLACQQDWTHVIFSDEKKFNLDGPDGFRYYWRDLRRPAQQAVRRQMGGGSVMVWGAMAWEGKSQLAILDGRQSSEHYIYTLSEYLLPFAHLKYGVDFIFQQDNAPIHTSSETRLFFSDMGLSVMDWPARSPDLNPIENLWSHLARRVYADGRQYDSIAELKDAILRAWETITLEDIRPLVQSMPRRCLDAVKARGNKTSY
ncbi:hypothetical protein P43SY_008143 [Pythium insidiosum]|uniref:Tc1-like transposase DDE domain-containing protein n=1 Tax=Pythium insidiosum TaxID=114742 RepID=A0AAD5LI92_PYTIN|nr:hypothetical protein P43SY_008143 [Pythium insidiosum]